jgi:ribonuclease HI
MGKVEEKELAIGMMALYQLWLARNEAREAPMIEDPEEVAKRAVRLVEEWQAAQVVSSSGVQQAKEHWLPPEPGWYKCNADGAFSQETRQGGGGVVLRDHQGAFRAGESLFFPHVSDPERAELLACHRAVQLAREKGIRKIQLETDCQGAVSKLTGGEMDRSAHGPLVEDIKKLLQDFEDALVKHVRRTCNEVAHKLAKMGCENKVDRAWSYVPPGFLVTLLDSDAGD